MSRVVGAQKPPAFYLGNIEEHLRMIVDYLTTGPVSRDGNELTEMVSFSHLEHAMTANTDDADFGGYSIVRIDSDGAYDLTGIEAGPGRRLLLINVSAFAITLKHETTSLAVNQLSIVADHSMAAGRSTELWYDSVTEKWRRIAG